MSTIIRDSFATYATAADAAQNFWDIVGTTGGGFAAGPVSSPLRFSTDVQAWSLSTNNGNVVFQKASPSNDATCFAYFAMITNQAFASGGGSLFFQLADGSNIQCTVEFTTTGTINVRTGGTGGAIVATFASAWSQQQWNGWNIQVVIHPTAGSVTIVKNGVTGSALTATNINTRGGSTNNYANQYSIYAGTLAVPSFQYVLKNLWFYNGTGAFPNSLLPNDVRTFISAPNAASQTQFTPGSAPVIGPVDVSGTQALLANNQYTAASFTPAYNGTVSAIALSFNAAATGNVILGLYDNTGAGGSPGTLLATSSVVTNPGIGVNSFAFASHPALSNLKSYYVAVLANVAITLNSSSGVGSGYILAQPYASGFANPGNMTANGLRVLAFSLTYQSANFTNVSELIEDGATTTISSSTVGNEDRYAVAPLPVTPTQIYGVQLRAFGQKSDSGARSGAVTVTSAGVNVVGTAVALSTSYENITSNQDVDPNTSAAWTPSGVNAALIGVKVAA